MTTELTEYQKEFLLNTFFKNDYYPGWKNIATKLLDNGSCVVAGDGCIWKGGIGNFIKTEVANDFVDCTLYKFDFDYFATSYMFKEAKDNYLTIISSKKEDVVKRISELNKEGFEIVNLSR